MQIFETIWQLSWIFLTNEISLVMILIEFETDILYCNGTYVELYTTGHLCTKFEGFILIYKAMIAKNELDLLLVVKYVKMTQLRWNSNSTCRAMYWMYRPIPSFKLISQSMLKKVRKTRTDGRTDRHCHGIIRPFFKRAYKNSVPYDFCAKLKRKLITSL